MQTTEVLKKVSENVAKVMVGKQEVTELLLAALAAGGHVLLEDMPGTGKTVLARSLAKSMDMSFSRIQFTPDLLPSDVTGLYYYHQKDEEFKFREGPVFTNLLLADEINRATPRTQSALLECMGEGQVSVEGNTKQMAKPFMVIATQNPVETLGCFPLPEAQLDRFLMKLSMGDLTREEETAMLRRFMTAEPLKQLSAVTTKEEISALQEACRNVYVHPDLCDYMVRLTQKTRGGTTAGSGVSPRGTLALLRASQGLALVRGRDFVSPEDIKKVAVPVLAHRLISGDMSDTERKNRILTLLSEVNVPTEDWNGNSAQSLGE